VQLLIDVRTIFQAGEIDPIGSAALVEQLIGLDEGRWGEWRGPNDGRPPCKLTQPQLAQLLRPFGIDSRTIWPLRRRPGRRAVATVGGATSARRRMWETPS
jgi:hypothetical protein